MCRKTSIYQSSNSVSSDSIQNLNHIGQLFRDFGEDYIQLFNPNITQIKLIRAVRICRTPALGGHIIKCTECGNKQFIYNSCGHSHCMICQSIKREQWVDKLKASLLDVPYVHCVFTLPHQLNSLARFNKQAIYSSILKASWNTIKTIAKAWGACPGMTSVLHTFGSDMKYHIHVHALVSFGGLNKHGIWVYPNQKYKLDRYRSMCSVFKSSFLNELDHWIKSKNLIYYQNLAQLLSDVKKIRWVVHSTRPTMDTQIIENYLARYINRVAVSSSRLHYLKDVQKVKIIYNDYKNQQSGKPVPKAFKFLNPLDALNQILQHVLPANFQKSRYYGLHHHSCVAKNIVPTALKRNNITIRTLFQILHQLLQSKPYSCSQCNSINYQLEYFAPDKYWIFNFIQFKKLRAPPIKPNNMPTQSNTSQTPKPVNLIPLPNLIKTWP